MGNGNASGGKEREMEERRPEQYEEDTIDLGKYWAVLWPLKWKICGLSLVVGVATLLLTFLVPKRYQSTAVISPETDPKRPNFAVGGLASFGVDFAGSAGLADLEMLFNSKDLTARVFRKYNLWPVIFPPDRLDPATGRKKVSWMSSIFGDEDAKEPKPPGDWDAIRAAKGLLKVTPDRRKGTITITFESRSAAWSAAIVGYYLEEGKSRLQEEALDRAKKNKRFIEEQIGKTVDALNRDRLYALLGQEVEREMMARNREQFGFRVIDSPRVPDRKSSPARAKTAVLATILAVPVWILTLGYRIRRRGTDPSSSGKVSSGDR